MAFVAEDGTGLSNATSYVTVDEFKDHHTDRGRFTTGDYTDTEIQNACVNATEYVDKRWGRRFRGYRSTRAQALEWPRLDAIDDDDYTLPERPKQLLKATSEYALVILKLERDLAPPPVPGFNFLDTETNEETTGKAGPATRVKEVVGPIEEETEYAESSRKVVTSTGNIIQHIPEYPEADLWMEELITSTLSRDMFRA
jgi:hypothetical protein